MAEPARPVHEPPRFETARERSRPELVWYLRHDAALARWPVIEERWARALERRRLDEAAGSRTSA